MPQRRHRRLVIGICLSAKERRSAGDVDHISTVLLQGVEDLLPESRKPAGHWRIGRNRQVVAFLDDAACDRPLQYLADFGHELQLIQIWAEEDRVPPWKGELELVDAETDARLRLQFDEAARDRYTRAFDAFSTQLQQLALRNAGRYAGVSTNVPLEEVIFGLVRFVGHYPPPDAVGTPDSALRSSPLATLFSFSNSRM